MPAEEPGGASHRQSHQRDLPELAPRQGDEPIQVG